MRDSPSPSPSLDEGQMSSNHSSSVSSSPSHTERTGEATRTCSSQVPPVHLSSVTYNVFLSDPPDPLDNGLSSSQSVLGHSPGVMTRDSDAELGKENKRGPTDRGGYLRRCDLSLQWKPSSVLLGRHLSNDEVRFASEVKFPPFS